MMAKEDLRGPPSDDRANTFVIKRTVISTAKTQRWSVLDALTQDPGGLIQTLKFAWTAARVPGHLPKFT
jgi:hypothetical protein